MIIFLDAKNDCGFESVETVLLSIPANHRQWILEPTSCRLEGRQNHCLATSRKAKKKTQEGIVMVGQRRSLKLNTCLGGCPHASCPSRSECCPLPRSSNALSVTP